MSKQNIYVNFAAICSLALSTTVMAGQVGSMNTFTAGTPAVAADVNANFSEQTSQINDNDARITAMRTGAVSVPAHVFRNETDAFVCSWTSLYSQGYGYFDTSSSATGSCDPVAGISLPDGVTLTGLNCSLIDNDATNSMFARLYRVNMATGAIQFVYITGSTTDSAAIQIVSDSTADTPDSNLVDNASYAYYVAIPFSTSDFSAIGAGARVYGCSVTY
jgi:hypothetical protein